MPAHKARAWLEKLKAKVEQSPKVLKVDVNYRWQWRGGIGWPYLENWSEARFNEQVYDYLKNKHLI